MADGERSARKLSRNCNELERRQISFGFKGFSSRLRFSTLNETFLDPLLTLAHPSVGGLPFCKRRIPSMRSLLFFRNSEQNHFKFST